MPDLLAHYAASLLVSSRRLQLKQALLISLVGLLPDVDALLRVHRWATHSIVLASLVILALYLAACRLKPSARELVAIAGLLYILHIAMDLFTGSTPMLYPLTDQSYYLKMGVDGVVGFNGVSLTPVITFMVEPVDFEVKTAIEGPVMAPEGVVMALVTAIVLAVEYSKTHSRNRRRKSQNENQR